MIALEIDWERFHNKTNHQEIALDYFPRPLNLLVSEIMTMNEKIWISEDKYRTYGADTVRKYGMTQNQMRWIEELAENLEDSGDEQC